MHHNINMHNLDRSLEINDAKETKIMEHMVGGRGGGVTKFTSWFVLSDWARRSQYVTQIEGRCEVYILYVHM